jgi:hypothetical protein
MSNYVISNNLSSNVTPPNVAWQNSWISVDNNAGRPLFANASYITNLDSINVSLSTSDLDIGNVHISDHTTGLNADVVSVGIASGALRVFTNNPVTAVSVNNLSTYVAAITANQATVVNQVTTNSLLNVLTAQSLASNTLTTTNNSLLNVLTANQATASNQVTTNSFLNSITANQATALNQVTTNSLLNSLTAQSLTSNTLTTTNNSLLNAITANQATALNQVTTNNLLNSLTAQSFTSNTLTTTNNSLLNVLTANQATASNQVTTNSLLNAVTANQSTQITLEKTLSANSVYGTLSSQPLYITSSASIPLNVTYADSIYIDESSRLRVATPQTQWWFMATVDKDGDLRYNESFVAGATSIFVQNLASVNMTSNTTSVSGQALRASRRRHKIIPGLSHEYTGVWNWDGQQANTVKRIGIFTQYNGYFFELSGTNAMNAVVRRRLPDGTLVEERVNQTEWNGDKLDGSGPSAENWNALTQTAAITGWVSTTTITPQNAIPVYNVVYGLSAGQIQNFRQGTKATITGITPSGHNAVATVAKTDTTTNRLTATYLFNPGASVSNINGASMTQTGYHMQHTYWIDFMGGRTNRIRFGKASDYGKIVLHTFRFDGLLGTAYENAPTLTERKEIYNIGTPTSFPSFTVMGNAFNVEAAVDITPNFNVARNDTGISFNTAEEFPILGLALRAGEPYQRADIQLQTLYIMDIANMDNNNNKACFSWRVVLNPSIQGTLPTSTNIGKASRQWAYTTANSVSGGSDLIGGYGISTLTENFPTALNFINMGSNIDNTDSDKIVVVAKLLNKGTANSSLVATMNFIEAL